jgi:pimeloyl-ACP methyl ester carboxylesterase
MSRIGGVLILLGFLSTTILASDCPIIFIHGHKSEAVPEDNEDKTKGGWKTWYPTETDGITLKHPTAMTRIIDSHYGGYTAGEPLHCDMNSTLSSTGGNTRKIYNFSYYHPNVNPGVISLSEESTFVYFSHGYDQQGRKYTTVFTYPPPIIDSTKYWPKYVPGITWGKINGTWSMIASDVSGYYAKHWKEGKFAKRLAEFIDKVLAATGAQKVDVVTHSMGGVVTRATIKNYGCASKVRKLLMAGTPNHTFADWWEEWYRIFTGDKAWQKNGENVELGVGTFAKFTIQGMSTIAGNKGRGYYGNKSNDGVVAVEQVRLSSAQFNPVIYASHSYDEEPEIALTTCTYNEEFIKNWIIDDNITHNGATVAGAIEAYDAVPFDNKWNNYELRLRLPINNYNKALVTLVEYWKTGTPYYKYYKAFPVYKYTKGCPGDPVFAKSPILADGSWVINPITYDMDGTVYASYDAIDVESPSQCYVDILSPSGGEVYTVQTAINKLEVKVKANFYKVLNFLVEFSPDGLYWTEVWSASNYSGDGIKTIQFAIPQVNSPLCKIRVKALLDTKIDVRQVMTETFTIRIDEPSELYCFDKDESKVGLDWLCGSILNFEVQRKIKYGSWETIAQGYWGPGSKSFYDNDVMRDTVYYYKVRSYGEFQGERYYTGFSNTIDVRTPKLNRPWHHIRVHSPASDRIVVKFRDLSNFETRFDVERKCPAIGEPWHVEKTLPAEPQSGNWVVWEDDNVKPDSTYFYRVMAYTSIEPAGYSAYTWKYGATVWPHLKTGNNDSATAYQPKVIYTPEDNLYYMTYAGENLLFASKSNNGIDWEGMNAVCYSGYPWIVNWDAGFSQVDINENGVPVVVFSIKGNSGSKDKKHWWSGINMGYFVADSNQWLDSITLYEYITYQEEPLLFFPFAFKVVGDTVHLVYFVDNILKYRWYNFATPEIGNPIDIGTVATGVFDMNDCYPVIDRDQDGNLYVAWFFGEYSTSSGLLMHYRERINGVWLATEEFEIPWRETWPGVDQGVRYLSIRRSNNKTYVLCTIAGGIQYPGITWLEEHSLALSVYEGSNWQTEWVFPDTTVSNAQLLTENLILYALEVNNNFDIYYQEKIGTGWSGPICIKNTAEKSKFPQGVFDGENIALIWTEGDEAPYVIDTAKVRVIPHVEIVFPIVENILGSRLRAGLQFLG